MKNKNMMTLRNTAILRNTLTLALVLASASTVLADAIVRTNGRRIENVQITKATYDEILYKKDGNTATVKGELVQAIERDSAVVARVRAAVDSGEYSKALKLAKKAEAGVQGWEAAEVAYLIGRIYLEAGKYKDADYAFATYLQANEEKKDYWVPHALHGRGRAAIAARKGGTAMQYFDQLGKFGDTWDLRATLGKAQGAVLKKSWVEARSLFQSVARKSSAPPAVQAAAAVGRIEVLVLQKQYPNAVRDLQSAFFDAPKPALASYSESRAKATLLMGVALKEQGGKENLEKAEIWLLRTAVIYKGHSAVYKEACKNLAAVYGSLGRADRATEWQRRAGA